MENGWLFFDGKKYKVDEFELFHTSDLDAGDYKQMPPPASIECNIKWESDAEWKMLVLTMGLERALDIMEAMICQDVWVRRYDDMMAIRIKFLLGIKDYEDRRRK